MDRRPLEELIQADLDGELAAAERAELARLLLQDPDARRLHDELRQTDRLLREVRSAEPPPGLRADILQGAEPRQRAWPAYRMAAIIVGAFVIVGLGYVVSTGNQPGNELQGSLGAVLQDRVVLRSDGAEVSATLQRAGEMLRLELTQSSTMPCEVIARGAASGELRVPFEAGNRVVVLEFSGAAPIELELRANGRLLSEGRLESAP